MVSVRDRPDALRECSYCGAPSHAQRHCPSCESELWTPPPGPFYRVAHRDERDLIASRGFQPADEGIDGQPAGVYLWASLDAAEDYLADKDGAPHDLYEIRAATVTPDPLWAGYGAWVSAHAISPAEITRLHDAG